MINIGDISKPSVSESPVRPRRSQSDGELVTATDSVEASNRVDSPVKRELNQNHQKKQKKMVEKSLNSTDLDEESSDIQTQNESIDPQGEVNETPLYDETGHQSQNSHIEQIDPIDLQA